MNNILMNIRLYPTAFPDDAMKVAYTLSGFDVKPRPGLGSFTDMIQRECFGTNRKV